MRLTRKRIFKLLKCKNQTSKLNRNKNIKNDTNHKNSFRKRKNMRRTIKSITDENYRKIKEKKRGKKNEINKRKYEISKKKNEIKENKIRIKNHENQINKDNIELKNMIGGNNLNDLISLIESGQFPDISEYIKENKEDYTFNDDSKVFHWKIVSHNKCPPDSDYRTVIKKTKDNIQNETVDSGALAMILDSKNDLYNTWPNNTDNNCNENLGSLLNISKEYLIPVPPFYSKIQIFSNFKEIKAKTNNNNNNNNNNKKKYINQEDYEEHYVHIAKIIADAISNSTKRRTGSNEDITNNRDMTQSVNITKKIADAISRNTNNNLESPANIAIKIADAISKYIKQ